MDDAVARVEDIIQIERLGGDITPKPIFDGSEIIGAQVDFNQLPELLQKEFAKKSTKKSADIIPFKPKTKKANGGTIPPLKGPASDGMGSLFRRK